MGADMIGYIIFGPPIIRLSKERRDKIIAKMTEILEAFERFDMNINSVFEKYGIDMDIMSCWSMPIEIDAPKKFVKAFISFWNREDGQDVVFRHLPQNLGVDVKWKVLFAGDMSSGGLPAGYGFQMFDTIAAFNLWDDFGVC
jgi:hypothetical protein